MRLHLGCGADYRDGYINVDAWPSVRADRHVPVFPLTDIADGSVLEILAIHVIESFYQWQVPAVLADWARVLKNGGRLILEGTDLDSTMEMAQSKDPQRRQWGLWGLYGRQDMPEPNVATLHHYVWRSVELVDEMMKVGFYGGVITRATTHVPERDFRIEVTRR